MNIEDTIDKKAAQLAKDNEEPSYAHELDKYSSDVKVKFFGNPSELPKCLQGKCNDLLNKRTLAFFGLDLKINQKGDVKVIVVGGANMNSQGMKKAVPDTDIEDKMYNLLTSFDKPVFLVTTYSNKIRSRLKELLGKSVIRLTPEQIKDGTYINKLPGVIKKDDVTKKESSIIYPLNYVNDLDSVEAIIINRTNNAIRFNEGKHVVVNPRKFEATMYDKRRVDLLLQRLKNVRPRSLSFDKNTGLNEYWQFIESCNDYLVLKDARGAGATGILIAKKSDILRSDGTIEMNPLKLRTDDGKQPIYGIEDILIEEYVKSQPYRKDGRDYDKCMRYLIAVDTMDNYVKLHHLGGYWRVAKTPLGDNPQTSMIITLSEDAGCVEASKIELDAVKNVLDRVFPIFYRRLLTFPLDNGDRIFLERGPVDKFKKRTF